MTETALPTQFKSLERWLDWALPTEPERYAKRTQTPLEEVKAFHAALQPHMEDVIRYLSRFEWGAGLRPDDEKLYLLGLAYMEAALPVDLKWKQSKNDGAFPYERINVPYRR